MSEQNTRQQHALDAEKHASLDFAQRVAHLTVGYNNSQSVVQFLDTKAAAVIAVVPIVLGVLAAVFNWLQGSWQWKDIIDTLGFCVAIALGAMILIIVGLLLIFSWLSIKTGFAAIDPQGLGSAQPSILFPCKVEKSPEEFASRVLLFTAGEPSQKDAIECYQRQVIRMSEIVDEKRSNVTRAIRYLKWVFLFSAISFAIMLLVAALSAAIAGHRYSVEKKSGTTELPASAQAQPASAQRSEPMIMNLLKNGDFWTGVGALAAVVATIGIGFGVRQLRFEAWVRFQEIFTEEDFTKARREIFRRFKKYDPSWSEVEKDKGLLVCRRMNEVCELAPYLGLFACWGKKRALQYWWNPIAKAWFLLEPLVLDEQKDNHWPEKWAGFQNLGRRALSKYESEVGPPEEKK